MNFWPGAGTPIIMSGGVFCGQHSTSIFEPLISKEHPQSGKLSAHGKIRRGRWKQTFSCKRRGAEMGMVEKKKYTEGRQYYMARSE
jgi:hypothetical protein